MVSTRDDGDHIDGEKQCRSELKQIGLHELNTGVDKGGKNGRRRRRRNKKQKGPKTIKEDKRKAFLEQWAALIREVHGRPLLLAPQQRIFGTSTRQEEQLALPGGPFFIGPQKDKDRGKKTLVLDMDLTLVANSKISTGDHDFKVHNSGMECPRYMYKRPWLEGFLGAVAGRFEIILFTAAKKEYAWPILDRIDPGGLISWRLSRDQCRWCPQKKAWLKELHRLGRPLSRCIMVDDWPEIVCPRENVLAIAEYRAKDPSDKELLEILELLMALEEEDDVRKLLRAMNAERWGQTEEMDTSSS